MLTQPDKNSVEKRDARQGTAPAARSVDTSSPDSSFQVTAPSVTLPKGGGAIRSIGEKFAANPVTGTGSMTVPIATSPGRSGFGPQLSLSYDSGAGNGPFGFGWNLSLPSITRKTDKGLPQYLDAVDSDVFILLGAEDLVPVYRQDPDGTWVAGHPGFRRDADGFWIRDASGRLVVHEDELGGYRVRRYRPRIEGLFARIERWSKIGSPGDVHWRSISKDNILTLYGHDENSRIADPLDPSRIFTWLICESRDDKGNGIRYLYKKEDGAAQLRPNQADPFKQAHQLNRGIASDPRRTAQHYLHRVLYGNRKPLLDAQGQRPRHLSDLPHPPTDTSADWLFEVRFDYGEMDEGDPTGQSEKPWFYRPDAFSSYRSGFEVRTCRRCERVLMLHHIPDQLAGADTLAQPGYRGVVRSTEFTYDDELDPSLATRPVYSFLKQVVQTGWKQEDGSTTRRCLPPVEFTYTEPIVQEAIEEVDPESLENLPIGLDGASYQWTDLHGESIPGILTEQAGAWFYKRNLSPINVKSDNGVAHTEAKFAPVELVAVKPNLALAGGAEFIDLAGDGQPDLVVMDGPTPGLYEHDGDEGWQPFRPFISCLNRDFRDPNLKFIDLDGDGRADVLISEDKAFVWHPSLAEEGFGPAQRVAQALDEEKGPRLVFADGTQSIYLADLSGDGLTDLVRIRNRDVCYWPNLGYGRFGAKVTMDHAPHFDHPDQFDHQRIRLADIDGSGTTDIIYLHRDGVRLYFNQSGNSWSDPHVLHNFPRVDELTAITPVDLLGNGTACLVWSSPLPGDKRRQMRYVDLMGGQKPHLLIKTANNLGAETDVHYAPSTKFYLADKLAGKPWITRLPFPVHVVERVETYDRISGNRFVTRYAYHHGYFDGAEREFRGFGMVEQFDTEEFAALSESAEFPSGTNIDASSHVPPVLTKTWFHTGVYMSRQSISNFFAGLVDDNDSGEHYREPGLTNAEAAALLLEDTVLPSGLSPEEEREACRALKGAMLRQEIYALDGTNKEPHPYTVTEQNFTIRVLQPKVGNRHAVFFTHAREAINYHYERNCVDPPIPADPRIAQALTLEVDDFGNVLKSAAAGYGRRQADPALSSADQARQAERLVTCSENAFTNPVDSTDAYRTPLPSESRTYELAGLDLAEGETRLGFDQLLGAIATAAALAYEEPFTANLVQKRLIEHVRTQFRPNDLGAAQGDPLVLVLLPLGQLESLALPGESYKLAFTPGLVAQRFGDKVSDSMLETEGRYVHSQGDANWWLPSGRVFLSPGTNDDPVTELAYARQHYFLPHRFRDPFHRSGFETESFVSYDFPYDLFVRETRDALGNVSAAVHDYRLLQPRLMTDPNGNRAEVAFDALGMVVGTAVMGKTSETKGDSLDGFVADLDEATILAHLDDPFTDPHGILQRATSRLVYDLFAYLRTRDEVQPQSAVVYTLVRETHEADLVAGEQTKIQHSFSYSDGFGREIQKKIQAELGPLATGGPEVNPRWVGTGWTVLNNKGKPVRQYEPFFTATHRFEFDVRIGVSPILFYDPVQRVVATLNPNHTWQKVVFDPWRQKSWDVSDTLLINPDEDIDVGDYVSRLNQDEYLPTWHSARIGGAMGVQEQAAAQKTEVHANTPAVAHMDSLGRTFLTIAHNRVSRDGGPIADEFYRTHVVFDIEGNQREVIDALERIVMRYDYDMLGNRAHQASMEAGERWMLNDVAGKALYGWDSRGHAFCTEYDALRRPQRRFVSGSDAAKSDPRVLGREVMFEQIEYGEEQAEEDPALNLRTRVRKAHDGAGIVTSEAYDFKGNLLRGNRRLASDYKGVPDWSSGAVALEEGSYASSTSYDALNRPIQLLAPHAGAPVDVIQPTYNEANLLERVDVWSWHQGDPAQLLVPDSASLHAVVDIDYNAKGQRERIDYGNGVRTEYDYDPLTFRLVRLFTGRNAGAFPDDCLPTPPADWPGCAVQNLHYTYDPVGNITHIQDDAQQTIYFRNRRVEPSNDYLYDATYQLIEATGREHLGQVGGVPIAHSYNDLDRIGLLYPGDGNAMGTYTERYLYDAVGNFLEMQHVGSDLAHPGWTRTYDYGESSLIEDGTSGTPLKFSNRLSRSTVGNGNPLTEQYTYDRHGNMLSMAHLQIMQWDFKDQLQMTQRQAVNADDEEGAQHQGERTYYVYDAAGQRVRKVTEHQAAAGQTPTRMKERIYLGGFEVYREYAGDGVVMILERETLHVVDDKQRIALVETRTQGDDGSLAQLIRYQFGNHLGSASLELDAAGRVISYEEYFPYGSASYQAVDASIKAAAKRYRYTGKERDEETGLAYHGARYYACWLGRWGQPDPGGIIDGPNGFVYARNRPVIASDPTGFETEQYNMFRASDAEAIHQIAEQAGFSDISSLYDELEATSVNDVSRVQIGGRDIEIALREPTSGSSGSSFTQALGIDYAIGAGIEAFLNSPLGVGPRTALAYDIAAIKMVPGLAESLTAITQNEGVQQTLGVIGDAGMLSMLTGAIRYGATKTTNLLTDSRMGQKLLTDPQYGRLSIAGAEGGKVALAEVGTISTSASRLTMVKDALSKAGLSEELAGPLLRGEELLLEFPTVGGKSTLAVARLQDELLSSGIIQISESTSAANAVRAFADFRRFSRDLAKASGATEYELLGIATINKEVEATLLRLGFEPRMIDVPEALGGGTVEALSLRFKVR